MEKRAFPETLFGSSQISATTGYGRVALGSWRDHVRALRVPGDSKTAVGEDQ